MQSDETQRLLNDLAQALAEDVDYPLDNTLLYAEVADDMASPSIFKNLSNHILYRQPDLDAFCYTLWDLWLEQPEGRRWAIIEYLVKDGKFDAVFVYLDEIDSEEESMDRRTRTVRRYFGEKPIVYPPFGEK